jgi:hypothetical protein
MQAVVGICARAIVQMSFSGKEKDLSAVYRPLLQASTEEADADGHEIRRTANDHPSPDSCHQTSLERVPLILSL